MLALFAGFVAGAGHVLAGPDHLGAVAPLAADSKQQAWRAGLRWGLGHSSGVLLVGLLFLLLRGVLPVELISGWSERLVGVVLIGIGVWGLRTALRKRLHAHQHEHDGHPHAHLHTHDARTAHRVHQHAPHAHQHTAFAVGTLHGLAGSSHFLGVLPALAFPTRLEAAGYLAAFGVGTIAAMIAFAMIVGLAARGLAGRGIAAYQVMMTACSLAAIGIGVYWLAA